MGSLINLDQGRQSAPEAELFAQLLKSNKDPTFLHVEFSAILFLEFISIIIIYYLGSFFIPLILIVFIYFKIFITQKKVADKRQNIKTAGAKSEPNGAKKKNNKVSNGIKLLFL